jgi:hypothetical protein
VDHRDREPVCTRRRSHHEDDRRRHETRARGGSVKPVSAVSNPRPSAAGVSKGTSIQVDMIGAQSCGIDVVGVFRRAAPFGARPVDHDFLDPLRAVALGSRRWCNSATPDLIDRYRTGWRQTPSASAPIPTQGHGRASPQWLLRYCQGATLSAVPRMAKTAQK